MLLHFCNMRAFSRHYSKAFSLLLCSLWFASVGAAAFSTAAVGAAAVGAITEFVPPSATATLPPTHPVRMGIHNFPPDFVVSKDGQHCGGTGFEFLRQVLQQHELQIEPVCVTPARMYLLLERNDIDFSINIKSTKALSQGSTPAVFVDPPYMMLQLVIYSHSQHGQSVHDRSIALIRGFDYQGQRQRLIGAGYKVVDMPDAISAIELFLKGRTEHLITYDGPFQAYIEQADRAAFSSERPDTLRKTTLQQIPTHIVIGAQSPYRATLEQLLSRHSQQYHCRLLKNCGPTR